MWGEQKLVNAVSEVASLLERCDLTYWLDAGTLLAIRRDASIAGQLDFDVGALYDAEALKAFVGSLKHLEYDVQVTSFESTICKVKIKTTATIPIDVVFYRKQQNLLVSPQKYRNELYRAHVSGKVAKYRQIFTRFSRQQQTLNFELRNNKLTYNIGSWALPLVLLSDFTTCDVTGFRVPLETDAYLTARYGDWKTPNSSEWVFSRDDGCFSKLCPSDIRKLHLLMSY